MSQDTGRDFDIHMAKSKPLVSIGLIAYNRESTLPDAIRSLLAQSYKNIELIISDDASSDDTSRISREFARKDKRVKFYRQKVNIGLPHNSNFVLSKAKGLYFMWASDDDMWEKDFIKTLLILLQKHEAAGLAMCNFDLYNEQSRKKVRMKYPVYQEGIELLTSYLRLTPLLVWGLFRTSVLRKAGGFHTDSRPILHWGSDNVTVFRTLLISGFCFTRKCLWQKRDSGHALNPNEGIKDFFQSKDIRKRTFRYIVYPVMFLYDYFAFIRHGLSSPFSSVEKIKLSFESTTWLMRVNIDFMRTLFGGLTYLFSRLFLRRR